MAGAKERRYKKHSRREVDSTGAFKALSPRSEKQRAAPASHSSNNRANEALQPTVGRHAIVPHGCLASRLG